MRTWGGIVLLVSLAIVAFAVFGLSTGGDVAGGLGQVGAALDRPIDSADWQRHWARSSTIYLVLGLGGCLAAVLLLFERTVGLAILAVVLTGFALDSLRGLPFLRPKYPFEQSSPVSFIVITMLAIGAWTAYVRARRADHID